MPRIQVLPIVNLKLINNEPALNMLYPKVSSAAYLEILSFVDVIIPSCFMSEIDTQGYSLFIQYRPSPLAGVLPE